MLPAALSARIVPVVETERFYIGLEFHEGATFAHTAVFVRFSPRLARELRAACDWVMAVYGGPVFAASHQPHGGDHAKFRKFTTMMGFSPFRTVRGTDGADHAVYVRWR